ncbi:MAG: ABC transporter substrate-binding protein [archaeon]|jgi:ABC-type branched-subunit amino acid transport system substrate-binding protein
MGKKIILGILAIIVLAILVITISPSATGLFGMTSTTEKYKIGVIHSSTGAFSDLGEDARFGIELAEEDFGNIKVIAEDDMSGNEKAILAAQKLIHIDAVNALITFRTGPSEVIAPIAEETKTPLLYSSTIRAPAEKNTMVFDNSIYMYKECEELAKILKGKKGALIGLNLESTHECINAFRDKNNPLTAEFIIAGDMDYSSIVTKAFNKKPDFIVLRGDQKANPGILKEINQQGHSNFQIICPHIYGAGCTNTFFLKEYSPQLKGALGTDTYVSNTPEIQRFKEKYIKKFGKTPRDWSFTVYENIKILSQALNACDGNKECVKEYLLHTEFDGLEGKLKFNSLGVVEKQTNIVVYDGNAWVKKN